MIRSVESKLNSKNYMWYRPAGGEFYSLSIVSRRHAGTTTQVQHTLSLRVYRVMSWRFGPAEVLDIFSTTCVTRSLTWIGRARRRMGSQDGPHTREARRRSHTSAWEYSKSDSYMGKPPHVRMLPLSWSFCYLDERTMACGIIANPLKKPPYTRRHHSM